MRNAGNTIGLGRAAGVITLLIVLYAAVEIALAEVQSGNILVLGDFIEVYVFLFIVLGFSVWFWREFNLG